MKKREYYLLNDVGQIYVRNKKIDTYIVQLRDKMDVNSNNEQFISLLGKYNALVDVRGKKHKQILDILLSTKQQAEELITYPICNELEYLKGYLEGLELVLTQDREIFDTNFDFVFFIFSTDKDLLNKYELSLSTSNIIKRFEESGSLRYFISSDAESICKKINEFDTQTEYAICVIYSKDSMPSKEIMQKLSFEKNDNVYFVSDKDTLKQSAEDIIKKIFSTSIL